MLLVAGEFGTFTEALREKKTSLLLVHVCMDPSEKKLGFHTHLTTFCARIQLYFIMLQVWLWSCYQN